MRRIRKEKLTALFINALPVILFFISSFQFYPVKKFFEKEHTCKISSFNFYVRGGNMSVCLNIGLPTPENPIFLHKKIGVTGFEPAASTSRT